MNRSQRRRADKIAVKPLPSTAAAQFFSQGVQHQIAGALDAACAAYETALALHPDHAEAHYNLGLALHHLGKLDQAIDCYRSAVVHDSRHALALNNIAMICKQMGRLEEAEAASLGSLEIEPSSSMFLSNLGAVLTDRGEPDRAAEAFEKALAIDPENAQALASFGEVLRRQGKTDEAVAAGRRAVAMQSDLVLGQYNLALALFDNGEIEDCLERFRLALALDPNLAEAHMHLALSSLYRGDFVLGWEEYEWRWRLKAFDWIREVGLLARPKWAGDEIADKTLVICAEQGLGDTIQFIRYLPFVLARAKRVVLWVQPALKALLRNVEGVQLVGMDERLGGVDVYCPLLSLPRIFATTPRTIPPVAPYIKAELAALERWRSRLGQTGLRVGISWQGKPGAEFDGGRSIPLACFAPLAAIPGVRLISLQKNFGTEQLADLPEGMQVETLGDDFDAGSGAFLDTVAVMENLDLVITSDTAIAHLAGSLGRPTWVALKRVPDWRWGIDATGSPWYPSMRLFRQTTAGDWDGVFLEIAKALPPWAAEADQAEDAQAGAG